MTLAVFGENTPAVAIALLPDASTRDAVGFTLTITCPILAATEEAEPSEAVTFN